jgi:protein gp37
MENSKIEWTHHTFNPWWGCIKVSPGCEHCYAETFSKRVGENIWGPAKTTQRRLFGDKHWAEPFKWNEAAKKAGERHRVFCASMADVFEEHPQVVDERRRLLDLIVHTPWLNWLLLTKRPENVNTIIEQATGFSESDMWFHAVGDHVWIGTSVENQEYADKRIPELLNIPAKVRFLSCEPLLGPVDLDSYFGLEDGSDWQECLCDEIDPADRPCIVCEGRRELGQASGIHWVIAGGESGHHARPMHPDWARLLRDQCQAAGVAFHFKQWGQHKCIAADDNDDSGRLVAVWQDGRRDPFWEPGPTHEGFGVDAKRRQARCWSPS